MSNYNKEYGHWKLPVKEFIKVRDDIIKEHNDIIDECVRWADNIHDKFQEKAKGLRGKNRYKVLIDIVDKNPIKNDIDPQYSVTSKLIKEMTNGHLNIFDIKAGYAHIDDVGLPPLKVSKMKKNNPCLKKMTKRDLKINDDLLYLDDFHISFDVKNNIISWNVHENNHAVEHAHEHRLAQRLFRSLNNVKWTNKTGGTLSYMDEYMKDSFSSPRIKNYGNENEPTCGCSSPSF
ncbi:MAG: hypothetical protein ACOCQ4_02985 [bacterium]